MHERTQRALARLAFVLCCALPTLLTVGTILITWTPWYHRSILRQLELQWSTYFGLDVSIADFQQVSPSRLLIYGLVMNEPETGLEVARVRTAKFVTHNDHVHMHLYQPELQAGQIPAFWRLFHNRFMCQPRRAGSLTRLVADDLTIHSENSAMTFRDIDLWLKPFAQSLDVTIKCLPAWSKKQEPIELKIVRDRTGSEPQTQWLLQTHETELPCAPLADFLPLLSRLGPNALFSGNVAWQWTEGQWQLDLQGARFSRIDLSHLFETLPHRLTGVAEIRFDRGRYIPMERMDLHGTLLAHDGYIGDSLIHRAQQKLQMQTVTLSKSGSNLPYDCLGLRFNMIQSQLQLSGICAGQPGYESLREGVVLCANGIPLVWTDSPLLPSTAIASMVAPEHSVEVPISMQTKGILNLLLPPSRPIPSRSIPNSNAITPRITRVQPLSGDSPISQPLLDDRIATSPEAPYTINR
jgi:hypothetical protein